MTSSMTSYRMTLLLQPPCSINNFSQLWIFVGVFQLRYQILKLWWRHRWRHIAWLFCNPLFNEQLWMTTGPVWMFCFFSYYYFPWLGLLTRTRTWLQLGFGSGNGLTHCFLVAFRLFLLWLNRLTRILPWLSRVPSFFMYYYWRSNKSRQTLLKYAEKSEVYLKAASLSLSGFLFISACKKCVRRVL